jgi:hypothetical protein
MVFVPVLRDVLCNDLACRALLVGFHVPHQLLILLRAHSITARNGRKHIGQKKLQGNDFGHEMIRSNTGGRVSRLQNRLANPFS